MGMLPPALEITELLGHAGEATGLECSTDNSGLSYCSIHGADKWSKSAVGANFYQFFLVSVNEQLACISHLLICWGQEQPKTLLVAE